MIVCQFVCIGACMIACVLYCCSYKDHSRSALLLISGPGWWANVEGDLRCPWPSGPEWERSSRVSPSAV